MNSKTSIMETKSIVLIGMFSAVLGVLSIITIPILTVPVTLQTFAIALCGFVLGKKLGTMSTFIYVLVGAVGVPIYAGMTGGVKILFGYTGGFLFGFILMSFLCGIALERRSYIGKGLFCCLGLVICHVIGVIQFSIVMHTSLKEAILLSSAPFWIKDIISVIVAYIVAMGIRRGLYAANILTYE